MVTYYKITKRGHVSIAGIRKYNLANYLLYLEVNIAKVGRIMTALKKSGEDQEF